MAKDYSQYQTNNKFYNGIYKKTGIVINDENYIIKFQKKEKNTKHFNHVSEYLGSHIFSILGIKAQDAFLGTYNGENVVLVKDFNETGAFFVPYNELMDLSLDNDEGKHYEYSFEDVIELIKQNNKMDNVKKTIETLWEIYIVDALIANAERHGNNWGFIKKDNIHTLAPIFDNQSSLYSNLEDDKEIEKILNDENKMEQLILAGPISPIKLNGQNSLYYEVIHSLQYEECNNALKRIVERINLEKIYTLVDSVDIVSDLRKQFYKKVIKERYEKILLKAYNKLVGDNNE